MILSIIIPCYNAEPYINELLDKLAPQITKDCEVLIIDDGSRKPFSTSYEWAKITRQKNAGASAARNAGLDMATGRYIAFIDADDLVADNYIETILNKIKTEKFDYCYMSWRAFGGWNMAVNLVSVDQEFPPFNCCVWNRIYKRSMIGKVRFNTLKPCAEDAQFIRDVKETGKKAFIADCMYFYRSNAKDSLTKRAKAGKVETRRIVYHFPVVTANMTYLINEFKELDYDSEVILMTDKNEIPELAKYAMVVQPQRISGTELRGVKTDLFRQVEKPLRTQVLLYVSQLYDIGGIETWTYNFCQIMHKYYDIMVLWDKGMDAGQKRRLLRFAQVVKNSQQPIVCDTVLNCRTALPIPSNIGYDKAFQIVHTCKMQNHWALFDNIEKIFVSEAARKSWDSQGQIIHNMTIDQQPKRAYLFVSATRLSWEKGENRIHRLAKMLHDRGVLFTWLVFSDHEPKQYTDGLVFRKPTLDILAYMQQADAFIQLSDMEAFCYSIVEALSLGVPVWTTPLEVLPELGFIEGVNGWTIPFEVEQCKNLDEILASSLKGFEYSYDNSKIIEQWRGFLGDSEPTRKTTTKKGFKLVAATKGYFDKPLNRHVEENEILEVPEKIAEQGAKAGFYEIIA